VKTIFNEFNACVGETSEKVGDAFEETIRPLWRSLMAEGYNPREISHLWRNIVAGMEAGTVLQQAMKLRKERAGDSVPRDDKGER